MSFAEDPELAVRCAQIVRKCVWCDAMLRPCNMGRHVAARHHRQLTIFDGMTGAVIADEDQAARWSEMHVEAEP